MYQSTHSQPTADDNGSTIIIQILFFIFAPQKLPQRVGQQQQQKCMESHQQVGI